MSDHIRLGRGAARGDPPLKKSGPEWHPSRKTNKPKNEDAADLTDFRRPVNSNVTDRFIYHYRHKPWVRREVRR